MSKEPTFEVEDIGCQCNNEEQEDGGYDSEWEWSEDQDVYVCTGCGDVQ
jgi:hypothetical protein